MIVTVTDIAEFLQMVFIAFKEPLFFIFTFMIAMSVIMFIRKLLIES